MSLKYALSSYNSKKIRRKSHLSNDSIRSTTNNQDDFAGAKQSFHNLRNSSHKSDLFLQNDHPSADLEMANSPLINSKISINVQPKRTQEFDFVQHNNSDLGSKENCGHEGKNGSLYEENVSKLNNKDFDEKQIASSNENAPGIFWAT